MNEELEKILGEVSEIDTKITELRNGKKDKFDMLYQKIEDVDFPQKETLDLLKEVIIKDVPSYNANLYNVLTRGNPSMIQEELLSSNKHNIFLLGQNSNSRVARSKKVNVRNKEVDRIISLLFRAERTIFDAYVSDEVLKKDINVIDAIVMLLGTKIGKLRDMLLNLEAVDIDEDNNIMCLSDELVSESDNLVLGSICIMVPIIAKYVLINAMSSIIDKSKTGYFYEFAEEEDIKEHIKVIEEGGNLVNTEYTSKILMELIVRDTYSRTNMILNVYEQGRGDKTLLQVIKEDSRKLQNSLVCKKYEK